MEIKLFLISTFIVSVASKNKLYPGDCLKFKEHLDSPNGCFKLLMQEDGNLVLYKKSDQSAIWSTNTYLTCSQNACYQSDGNFIVSNCEKKATWAAGSFAGGNYIELQDDGNIVNYAKDPLRAIWASNSVTNC